MSALPKKAPIVVQLNEPEDFRVTTSHIAIELKIDIIGSFGDLFRILEDIDQHIHTNPFLRDHEVLRAENREFQRNPEAKRGLGARLQTMARDARSSGYAQLDRNQPALSEKFRTVDNQINELFRRCVELEMSTRLASLVELRDRFRAVNQSYLYEHMIEIPGARELYLSIAETISGLNGALLKSSFAWQEESQLFDEPQLHRLAIELSLYLRALQRQVRTLDYVVNTNECPLEEFVPPTAYQRSGLYRWGSDCMKENIATWNRIIWGIWPFVEYIIPVVQYYIGQTDINELHFCTNQLRHPLELPHGPQHVSDFRDKTLDIYDAYRRFRQELKAPAGCPRMAARSLWLFFECMVDYVAHLSDFIDSFGPHYLAMLESLTAEEREEYRFRGDLDVELCRRVVFNNLKYAVVAMSDTYDFSQLMMTRRGENPRLQSKRARNLYSDLEELHLESPEGPTFDNLLTASDEVPISKIRDIVDDLCRHLLIKET